MISKPHLDGLPVVRVPVRGYHRVPHQLACDGTGEFIPEGGAPYLFVKFGIVLGIDVGTAFDRLVSYRRTNTPL